MNATIAINKDITTPCSAQASGVDSLENVSVFNASFMQIKHAEDMLNRLKKSLNDCMTFMENEPLASCPKCHKDIAVKLVYVKPHLFCETIHGLRVECTACNIQTATHYWHETASESSLKALQHAYANWGDEVVKGGEE